MAINRNPIPLQHRVPRVGYTAYALATFLPPSKSKNAELALDIESENEWEAMSGCNEDDAEVVMEGRKSCCPHLRGPGDGEGEGKVKGMERETWRTWTRVDGSVVGG